MGAEVVMRRSLMAVVAVLLAVAGCSAVDRAEPRPVAAAAAVTTTSTTAAPPTTTSTTLPPPTTAPPTTVPPPVPAQPARPVRAPANSYAAEAVRVIGTIEIPKLGLRSTLGEGISLRNIDRNPSHWPGTALPGQPGNVVVAGHRVTHTRPFRNIDRLVPGDEVLFTVGGARYRYVVTGSQVVTPSQTEIVNQTPDATGTLFACHPPGSARYRYVVHLKLA